jgi:hypothetical protein
MEIFFLLQQIRVHSEFLKYEVWFEKAKNTNLQRIVCNIGKAAIWAVKFFFFFYGPLISAEHLSMFNSPSSTVTIITHTSHMMAARGTVSHVLFCGAHAMLSISRT